MPHAFTCTGCWSSLPWARDAQAPDTQEKGNPEWRYCLKSKQWTPFLFNLAQSGHRGCYLFIRFTAMWLQNRNQAKRILSYEIDDFEYIKGGRRGWKSRKNEASSLFKDV